jgi:esterase/lipase superfamily enzyme
MVLLSALGLAGCGETLDAMSGGDLLRQAAQRVPLPIQIFVASTRPTDRNADAAVGEAHYSFDIVTVPPHHTPGAIERPTFGSPDPASSFVLAQSRRLDPDQFRQEVAIHMSGRVGASRDILVFVHGYNTSLEDAHFRFAQIVADSHFSGIPVLFTWPSRASLFGYGSDKESATASRDALERLLEDLSQTPGLGRIDVLAHSMGCWLAMEALRQSAIAGHQDLGGHLGNVMLAAPDIDLNVFSQQISRIGEQSHVAIFVSSGDRALSLSSRLAGDRPRVGALDPSNAHDAAELDRLGVKVYDLSAISDGLVDHTAYADAPDVVRSIGAQLAEPRPQDAGMAPVAGDSAARPLDTPSLQSPVSTSPLAPPPGANSAAVATQ